MNGRTFWDFAAESPDFLPLLFLVGLPLVGILSLLAYGLARLWAVMIWGWPPPEVQCCCPDETEDDDEEDEE